MNVKKLMDNQKCLPVVCDCDNNVGFVLICVGFSAINMLKYGNAFMCDLIMVFKNVVNEKNMQKRLHLSV